MARKNAVTKAVKREDKNKRLKQNEEEKDKIKDAIIKNENFRKRICKGKDCLKILERKRFDELDDEKKKKRFKFLRSIGAWKFNVNPKEQTQITIEDFSQTCDKLERLNEHLLKTQLKNSTIAIMNEEWPKYYVQMHRLQTIREKTEILKRSSLPSKEKENKTIARSLLDKNITQMQCSVAILKKILDEQNEAENNDITFEDYIDQRLKDLKEEMKKLRSYIDELHIEQQHFMSLTDGKMKQVALLKKQLREIEERDFKESQAFAEIIARKENLEKNLSGFQNVRELIAKETTSALNLRVENDKLLEKQEKDCKQLERIIERLKTLHEEMLARKENGEKSCAVMRGEIADVTEQYYKQQHEVEQKKCLYQRLDEQYQALMEKKVELQKKNETILGMLTQFSVDTQEKYF